MTLWYKLIKTIQSILVFSWDSSSLHDHFSPSVICLHSYIFWLNSYHTFHKILKGFSFCMYTFCVTCRSTFCNSWLFVWSMHSWVLRVVFSANIVKSRQILDTAILMVYKYIVKLGICTRDECSNKPVRVTGSEIPLKTHSYRAVDWPKLSNLGQGVEVCD